ncbi:MAG: thioredoxin fold domain-containing protein [Labilithrix sp.]|nr:thioredoxin fold domain-containing protein [Labilithrix sp.]
MIHVCPSCSAKNRVPAARVAGPARCGMCRAQLLPPKTPLVLATDGDFDELVNGSPVPVLVDFWAPWCAPCQIVGPEIDKLAATYAGEVVVAKVNTEQAPELAARNGVRVIPTFVRFDRGKETARHRGAEAAPQIAAALKIGHAA